jgi:hypothetical protein
MPLVSTCRASFVALGTLTFGFGLLATRTTAADEKTVVTHGALMRPNGRQVVRMDGLWLVVTPEPSGRGAWLATASFSPPLEMSQSRGWQQFLFLSPDDRGLFHSSAERRSVVPPSLGVDGRGRLHAAWDSGDAIWYAQTVGAGEQRLAARSQRSSLAGGDAERLADRTQVAFRFRLAAKGPGPKLYGFGFAPAAASAPGEGENR